MNLIQQNPIINWFSHKKNIDKIVLTVCFSILCVGFILPFYSKSICFYDQSGDMIDWKHITYLGYQSILPYMNLIALLILSFVKNRLLFTLLMIIFLPIIWLFGFGELSGITGPYKTRSTIWF